MSTWHQERNPRAMAALWAPDKFTWKVIDDKPGQLASCMTFPDKESAESYQQKCGGVLIEPSHKEQSDSARVALALLKGGR